MISRRFEVGDRVRCLPLEELENSIHYDGYCETILGIPLDDYREDLVSREYVTISRVRTVRDEDATYDLKEAAWFVADSMLEPYEEFKTDIPEIDEASDLDMLF